MGFNRSRPATGGTRWARRRLKKTRQSKRPIKRCCGSISAAHAISIRGLLGETYLNLFSLIKDDAAISDAELLTTAKGMIQYEKINLHSTYPVAAIALAERKTNFREAEAMAREGIVEAKKKIDSQRQFYKTDAEYEKGLNWMTGMMYDALGWVFFNEGRMEEAEKELLHAHSLVAEDLNNLYHIGQFYQAKKDYAKAEEYYIKGSLVPTPGENKNTKALKELYKLRKRQSRRLRQIPCQSR